MTKLLTVVVPVYNEIEVLPLFYERVTRVLDSLEGLRAELLFVDDGSDDGSYAWLEELVTRDERVRVLRFSRNFGSYVALTAGLVNAVGDAAVMLSADLQDPPELMPELVAQWRAGYDVVWAARRSRVHDPLWRRMTANLFYAIFRRIAFSSYPPKGYDFCLIDRAVIDAVSQSEERNTSIFALIVWAGFRSTAIPYDRGARARGQTHWNLAKMGRLALDATVSFSVVPVRLALWCGAAAAFVFLLYTAFILYGKLTGRFTFPPGWPSTMAVILLSSAVQFLILAVLGEYLWRALDQTRGRPNYVIARRLGYDRREPAAGSTVATR